MRDAAAVADSGPLIGLAKIDQLELLPALFAKILIPPEVWHEVTVRGGHLPGADKVRQAAAWFVIQEPDPNLAKSLSILVDEGEAQAIALAQTVEDCTIILDDSRARKIAERMGIRQIGTVGLLLRAKRRGLIERIRPHLEALIAHGIYIRKELIDAVLKEAGE